MEKLYYTAKEVAEMLDVSVYLIMRSRFFTGAE